MNFRYRNSLKIKSIWCIHNVVSEINIATINTVSDLWANISEIIASKTFSQLIRTRNFTVFGINIQLVSPLLF
jgi:hypothetical protein